MVVTVTTNNITLPDISFQDSRQTKGSNRFSSQSGVRQRSELDCLNISVRLLFVTNGDLTLDTVQQAHPEQASKL